MKKLIIITCLALSLAACAANKQTKEEKPGGGKVDTAAAKQVFKQNCASCHGQNLEGTNAAPKLSDVGKKMSKDQILNQIKNGGGGMPGGLIKGNDAENVAGWLASKK
ncbi:cytochrome c [Fictibacillus sp. Mic-4]|uniref:c-type cytochrome n=1 Tax=Fictibacillus TaxID=1329200 RepID=UPI000422274D|nr:cytochrome c [Fictibacillus gelatini]